MAYSVEIKPQQVALSSIAFERKAKSTPTADDERPYVALEHIASDCGGLLGRDTASNATSNKTEFQTGDILFGKLRPNLRKCVQVDFDGVCSTDILALHPKNGFSAKLLLHILRSDVVMRHADATAIGTKMPRTSWKALGECNVTLPPERLRKVTADALDAIDGAIERTRAVIDQTRKLKMAMLDDLLTNGLPGQHKDFNRDYRLGRVPADWKISRIQENADVTQGIALGPHRTPRQNPTPYLRVANVQNGFVDSSEIKHIETTEEERTKYALREGDVLIVEGHANIEDLGRAALVPATVAGMVFQNHLFRIRTKPELLDARYLSAWINSIPGRTYFRIFGGTTSGLNTVGSGQIRTLRFPLPPIEEQRAICDLAEATEQRVAALVDEMARLQGLKSALSQVLLTDRVPFITKGGE